MSRCAKLQVRARTGSSVVRRVSARLMRSATRSQCSISARIIPRMQKLFGAAGAAVQSDLTGLGATRFISERGGGRPHRDLHALGCLLGAQAGPAIRSSPLCTRSHPSWSLHQKRRQPRTDRFGATATRRACKIRRRLTELHGFSPPDVDPGEPTAIRNLRSSPDWRNLLNRYSGSANPFFLH